MLGQVIHGYRIDRAMSADKGGFGDVYFASHIDSGAEAVVKVLKPEMSAQRDIVARFFNEARAAASVHHPGIVQIHNMGYHGDRAYLLMERLHGEDLENRLARGALPLDRALVFLRQTAGAIGAAHDRGIVHRDLKPANLFIVSDPDVAGGERIKVLDFGIAKLGADAGAGKTQGVFGTPSYMSPEQCASTGAVDARADLYSLGCIFYELCCGRPPFGHGGLELIASHLRDTPSPPSAVAPWLPPAIERTILALLEKQPERRLPSCAALIAALDGAMASASHAHGFAGAPSFSGASFGRENPSVPQSSTTLGSSAGAASTLHTKRRKLGTWIGLAAVVAVTGVVAIIVGPGRQPVTPAGHGFGSDQSSTVHDVARDAGSHPDAPISVAASVPLDALLPEAPSADAAGPSAADTRPPHTVVSSLVKAGIAEMYANRYVAALALFEQAALEPNPGIFFNIAVAAANTGNLDLALAATHAVLSSSPEDELAIKTNKMVGAIDRLARKNGENADSIISRLESEAAAHGSGKTGAYVELLFESGRDAMRASRFDLALLLFQKTYELDRSGRSLFDVGTVQRQLGQCVEARGSFEQVIETWPSTEIALRAKHELTHIATACKTP